MRRLKQAQHSCRFPGAVAKATGAKHEVVPVRGPSIEQESEALVKRIAQEYPGRTVLVVGHSNTVPVLVSKATGATVDPIPETEYGRMYIVTMRGSKGTVVQAAY